MVPASRAPSRPDLKLVASEEALESNSRMDSWAERLAHSTFIKWLVGRWIFSWYWFGGLGDGYGDLGYGELGQQRQQKYL